jgi:molybdopterin molybdotransferase
MLSVDAAQKVVLQHARALPARATALPDALGLVLAEDVASDLDMPPFDKAMMDGYAVRVSDLRGGRGILTVIDEITAGKTPTRPLGPGQAARIMTGAPVPVGTEAVVAVENTRAGEHEGDVAFDDPGLRPGRHVLERGREMRAGEVVLRRGASIGAVEIGVLATVGKAKVLAIPRPTVAILPTGDEIVDVAQRPGPGQIRNSNGPMLAAFAARAGGSPRLLESARDRMDDLHAKIEEGLRADVLLLCGGVSAGKLDLVPAALEQQGVQPLFHKVQMKPGKPLLFGVRGEKLVFGLPGNPVSAVVCFALFVRPTIWRLRGLTVPWLVQEAVLAEDFRYRTDRPTYHPARLEMDSDGWRVRVVPWFGSPDLRGLTACDCFVVLPAGDLLHRAGARFPVLRLDTPL